ncbi:TcfC E-set like domain-containing protein [Cysteiniphilum litorale]|uniref:TcfC E-set like domain-containing protein n=1 Tax=Cysteiniphilum litorale TaxID=2056700 RepID=UPI003F884D0D
MKTYYQLMTLAIWQLFTLEMSSANSTKQQSLLATGSHGYHTIPDEFRQALSEQFEVNISISGIKLGQFPIAYRDERIFFDIEDILSNKKIHLKAETIAILRQVFSDGLNPHSVMSCSDTLQSQGLCQADQPFLSAHINFEQMTLALFLAQDAFEYSAGQNGVYLSNPSSNTLSSLFGYQFNFNYSDNRNTDYYLELNNITGLGRNHLNSSLYFQQSSSQKKTRVNNVYWQNDQRNLYLRTGYFNNVNFYDGQTGYRLSYGFNGKGILTELGSSDNLAIVNNKPALVPIPLFLDANSTVNVYKDGRLISVQNFAAGNHYLQTESFPSGIYPIDIKITQGSSVIQKQTAIVNKPSTLNKLHGDNTAYRTWLGVVSKDQDSSIKAPYLGGNYALAVTKNAVVNAGGYIANNLVLTEIDSEIYLPFNSQFTPNLAMDSTANYGVSLQLSTPWNSYFTTNLWYNTNSKSDNGYSSFKARSNRTGLSTYLDLQRLYIGSISTTYSYNLRDKSDSISVNLYRTLYNRYGFNVSLSASYNDYFSSSTTATDKGYSLSLNFSYFFGNGSSMNNRMRYQQQNNQVSNNFSFSPKVNSSYLRNVNANVDYHKHYYNAMAGVGLTSEWMEGDLSTSSIGRGSDHDYSATGNLKGNVILGANHLKMHKDKTAKSGVMLNMHMPDDSYQMSAQINGAKYPLKNGQNFIPLRHYKQYEIAVHEHADEARSVYFKDNIERANLYPGSIYQIEKVIFPVVEVIGQLVDHSGKAMPHTRIISGDDQFAKTYTDDMGYFVIKISQTNPKLYALTKDHTKPIQLNQPDIQHAKSGAWIGTLTV